jgi:hypothetical protein
MKYILFGLLMWNGHPTTWTGEFSSIEACRDAGEISKSAFEKNVANQIRGYATYVCVPK